MRYDWLADRWVIVAPQRTKRPDDFVHHTDLLSDPTTCPFCAGKESETPRAVATYYGRQTASKLWRVRVVPNKFPAVSGETNGLDSSGLHVAHGLSRSAEHPSQRIDLFQRRDMAGVHEVVVESPKHISSISDLDRESMQLVFRAYVERLDYCLNTLQLAYAVVFKNVGQDAGASLAHTHSQLIATDFIPTDIQRTVSRLNLFLQQEGTCLFCRMVNDELEQSIRIVEQTPDFVAFCPFASRIPSLVTLAPKRHQTQFEKMTAFEAEQLSWLTHRLVRRIEKCYPDSAYNFVIHTAPRDLDVPEAFHWRLELFPRLTKVAGFEWGSDCYINPLSPEEAARKLRNAGV